MTYTKARILNVCFLNTTPLGPVTAAGQVCYIPTQIIYKLPDDANTHNVHALYFWPISKIKQHEKFVKQPLVLSLCDQAQLLQRETQMTFL